MADDAIRKGEPVVLCRGPDRAHRRWEVRIGESADGDAHDVGQALVLPEHSRAAFGTEVEGEQAPLSACRRKVLRSPSVATICPRGKKAWAPNSEPVRRWQARQWHDETMLGAPAVRMRNWPQVQAAARSTGSVMRSACH